MHNDKLILGIDTSTSILDVAIFDSNGKVLASEFSDNERTHSERVMLAVDKVLERANLSLKDIDIFACCVGSGSYTGVRIGVATAKGLAMAMHKPVMGISSFDLMAHNVIARNSVPKQSSVFSKSLDCFEPSALAMTIVPIIDARRGAVFAAVYENGKQVVAPRRIDLEELKKELGNKEYEFIEPYCGKWEGIILDMLGNVDIIYLGGSV